MTTPTNSQSKASSNSGNHVPISGPEKVRYMKLAQTLHSQASEVMAKARPGLGLTVMIQPSFEKANVGSVAIRYTTRVKGVPDAESKEQAELYTVGCGEILRLIIEQLPCDEPPGVKCDAVADDPAGTLAVRLSW